jgi:hypothetical protein
MRCSIERIMIGKASRTPTVLDSETLWQSVDRLLQGAVLDGIRVHKLGPLAARRLRRLGQPVPSVLAADERAAVGAMMIAKPLLERIRASCEGPLLLVKGPEVASIYPGRARSYSDVDLITPSAAAVHRALRAAGFEEVDDPDLFRDHHHLRPLKWPTLGLKVEVHLRPNWPRGVEPPAPDELVEGAVSSRLGVDGLSTPNPIHHALIIAAHAWEHEPLGTLRDLVDVAAVCAGSTDAELERAAQAWRIPGIWSTTYGAARTLFDAAPPTLAVRLWGRHLPPVRERTVLDNHLQRWLHPFWELPMHAAVLATADAFRQEVLPMPGEAWQDKLARTAHAIRHPREPLSVHREEWREPARRRASRKSPPS